jgi:hypothetical protein
MPYVTPGCDTKVGCCLRDGEGTHAPRCKSAGPRSGGAPQQESRATRGPRPVSKRPAVAAVAAVVPLNRSLLLPRTSSSTARDSPPDGGSGSGSHTGAVQGLFVREVGRWRRCRWRGWRLRWRGPHTVVTAVVVTMVVDPTTPHHKPGRERAGRPWGANHHHERDSREGGNAPEIRTRSGQGYLSAPATPAPPGTTTHTVAGPLRWAVSRCAVPVGAMAAEEREIPRLLLLNPSRRGRFVVSSSSSMKRGRRGGGHDRPTHSATDGPW